MYSDLSIEKLPLEHLNSFTKNGVLIMKFLEHEKQVINLQRMDSYNVNGIEFKGKYVPTKIWETALAWLSKDS